MSFTRGFSAGSLVALVDLNGALRLAMRADLRLPLIEVV